MPNHVLLVSLTAIAGFSALLIGGAALSRWVRRIPPLPEPHAAPIPEPVYLTVTPQGISDKRPIGIMTFGAEERDPAAQADVTARVRSILVTCGCYVAEDITKLGCTGVVAAFPVGGIDVGNFLRIGLAGGGVGLPCFVPISHFCLVHNTIGGLEPGQKAYHAEVTEALTRELTPSEKARVAVVERARRIDDDSLRKTTRHAADVLSGRDRGVLREVVAEMENDDENETEGAAS